MMVIGFIEVVIMARKGRSPFIKPNFKKISQMEDESFQEEDIREVIVEHKSGFNIVEVLIIIVVSIAFGVAVGNALSIFRQEYQGEEVSDSLQELIAVYNNILDSYYEDLDEQELADAAINGMMSSLDDYSMYMDEENATTFNETVDGSYQGVGVTITVNDDNQFLILDVSADSPAEKAGIRSNDILTKIDGDALDGKSLDDVTSLVRDSGKEKITFTLLRDGEELEKEVSLGTVDLVSVLADVYPLNNGNAGYIYINSFAANTYKQFKKELKKLEKDNINSLIIDVRSNPGGHLGQTKKILELFMDKGSTLYQVQFKDDITNIKDKTKASRSYPVVVLMNSSSASASEILAASFQDSYEDATLIGEKTYGKGTVQTAYSLSDGSSIKYTTEKWLTPKGKWIDGVGVTPDKNILLTDVYLSNPIPENDFQLQSALDYLESKKNTSEN